MLKQIHEVYQYDDNFPIEPVDESLFGGYINTFLKIKTEAAGPPSDRDLTKFIQQYEVVEGIKLDRSKIIKNPGLYSISKMLLNTLWGKLCQKSDRMQSVYVRDYAELISIHLDPTREIVDLHPVNDELLLVSYKHKSEFIPTYLRGNCVLGSYVTCYGRLKVYDDLEKINPDDLAYMDTDSLIFRDKGQLQTGCFLGELTNEVEGSPISEFIGFSPKSYVFKQDNGKMTSRFKGLTLTQSNAQVLNFEKLKSMLLARDESKLSLQVPFCVRRDKKKGLLHYTPMQKQFKIKYDKRFVLDNQTLPWGYCE